MRSSREPSLPNSTSSSLSTHQSQYTYNMTATSVNFFNAVTPVPDWSEADVKEWLQSVGFDDLAHVSEEHGIDGAVLIHLDFESLKDLGFVKVGQRLRLMRLINELMGFSEDSVLLHSNVSGEQTNPEGNMWNAFHNQNDRIRVLEHQVWTLQEITQTLRERTDSLSSFNTSWTVQSCPDSLALQSSKPSADSGNSTPPTTASSIRTAVTSSQMKMQDAYSFSNYAQSPRDPTSSNQSNVRVVDQPAGTLDGYYYTPLRKVSQKHTKRSPISPQGSPDLTCREVEFSPPNSRTPQAIRSPRSIPLLPAFSQNPELTNISEIAQERSQSSVDVRHNSLQKVDGNLALSSPQGKSALGGGNGFVVARKPSLLTRRVGAPSQGIGVRSMRSGGVSSEDRSGAGWKRSSSTTILCALNDDLTNHTALSPSKIDNKPLMSPTAINRSASTSNLKAVNGSDLKLNHRLRRLNSQTSVRVKSNDEQTVIEVLSNHLSTFYANEPHAWSKHVLLLRINDLKEYALSYDDIPLKVYRSFKPREGIDFAIRPIEDIPSPLRLTGNNRRKNSTFSLEDELATPDDSKLSNEEAKKLAAERKPLAFGLAICGYQAELSDELSIKAGESFKLKSHLQGRYLLERESNMLSSLSPLSAFSGANWAQSSSSSNRLANTHSDHAGWVPESCILEITQSIRTLNSNGSSLKDLISSPLENADGFLDMENLTTFKVCLIPFQSQSITWSGELGKVAQGEKIRVFNCKTRFHWVYCLRESNGERGWLPKWILSGNLRVLPESKYADPQNKLQTYLLQHKGHQLRHSVARPLENSSNRNAVMLGRSASSASALKKSGIHKSKFSPTSLQSIRAPRIQTLGSDNVAHPASQLSSPSSTVGTPDGSQEAPHPETILNRSVDGARSLTFTPRSRRSRINSVMAS